MFTGDECLAGKNPVQGTELCSVVEFLYSLEILASVLANPSFGDRLERVAFNALPATFTPDMWAHQYDQQVNQVQCTINPDHMWTTNGPESNLYGLEPNYGCCTSNMHQGWPKFAAHLWMKTPDEGIAAVAYAPSTAAVPDRMARRVTVTLETDYPFRETLKLTVKAEKPARFPLVLRVPAWAEGATIRVAGAAEEKMKPGTFHRLEREWKGAVELEHPFPDESENFRSLQRSSGHRARAARLFTQAGRELDARKCRQAAPGTAARRFRGAAVHALELRHWRSMTGMPKPVCGSKRGRWVRGPSRRKARA